MYTLAQCLRRGATTSLAMRQAVTWQVRYAAACLPHSSTAALPVAQPLTSAPTVCTRLA